MLSGCGWIKRFWYDPVPVANAIGEEKAKFGNDTVNVYRDPRFEVYGPSAGTVYDGYEQMNRTYRLFDLYFGAPAPKLAVLLADSEANVDSSATRELRARGFAFLSYVRPRSARNRAR